MPTRMIAKILTAWVSVVVADFQITEGDRHIVCTLDRD